jgi:alanyl-tRNA synthetase
MNKKIHTGEHILFRALSTVFEGLTVKKVEFGKRNYFLVQYDKEFNWDGILKAEIIANRIIAEGRPVRKVEGPKKEIQEKFPHLRVRWDRIRDDTVTVVEVEDYDWAACIGDHVENTREIEYILVTRVTSVGKGHYEIEFEVGENAKEEALKRSALAGEVACVLRTSLEKVVPTIRNVKEDQEKLTESVRLLTKKVVESMPCDSIGGITVYIDDLTGADRRLLQREAAQITRRDKSLVVLVEQSQDVFVVAARSPSLQIDCTQLIKTIAPGGRGGGKPECAVASSTHTISVEEVKAKIRQFLEK